MYGEGDTTNEPYGLAYHPYRLTKKETPAPGCKLDHPFRSSTPLRRPPSARASLETSRNALKHEAPVNTSPTCSADKTANNSISLRERLESLGRIARTLAAIEVITVRRNDVIPAMDQVGAFPGDSAKIRRRS